MDVLWNAWSSFCLLCFIILMVAVVKVGGWIIAFKILMLLTIFCIACLIIYHLPLILGSILGVLIFLLWMIVSYPFKKLFKTLQHQ